MNGLGAWTDHYHLSQHASLGSTPLLCWQRDIERVRRLPPDWPGKLETLLPQ
jgi:hypothetical protein